MEKSRFEPPYQNKMLEIKSTDDFQSSRLNTIEALDKTQNERLNAIESVNATQTKRLDAQDEALETEITKLKAAEDERARKEQKAQEEVDRLQNSRLDTAESVNAQQTTDISNQADKDTELEGKIGSNKSAIDKNAENIDKNASAAENALNAAKKDLQESIRVANDTIEALQNTVTDLSNKLTTAQNDLTTTQTKATQLEGLLSLYAKNNSAEPTFKLIVGSQGRTEVDITYIIAGNSVKVSYEVTDDPNWSASAYSDLQVNSDIIHATSYVATVSENLTLKYKNTLTDKETPARTIQFFTLNKPTQPETQPSWVTNVESDRLNWITNLHTLTDSAETANGDKVRSYTKYLQYSTDDNDWTTLIQGTSLETVFGDSIQSANFRYYWKATDVAGNFVEAPVSLGSLERNQACRTETTYKISNITTSSKDANVTNIQTTSAKNLSTAFNGSFKLVSSAITGTIEMPASFTDEYTILLSSGAKYIRSLNEPVNGKYEFVSTISDAKIYVTIEETTVTEWYTVQ